MKTESLAKLLMEHLEDKRVLKGENGASFICPLPDVGSHAFLHVLFDPVPVQEIEAEAVRSGFPLLAVVLENLMEMNGALLFRGALSIYGVRGAISRDPLKRKPHDIYEINTLMRPKGALPSQCFLGSYSEDGSWLYTEASDGAVYRRQRKTSEIMSRWPTIDAMIVSEVARLSQGFDRYGAIPM